MKNVSEARAAEFILTELGFNLQKIPREQNKLSADFWLEVESSLIEVKGNQDLKRELTGLQKGEVSIRTVELSPNRRMSKLIRYACKQLASSALRYDARHRFIWFCGDDDDICEQFQKTFLGQVDMIDMNSPGKTLFPCFGFDYSPVWHFPEVDGAVLDSPTGLRLITNIYSSGRLGRSKLYQRFLDKNGLYDPRAEVKAERAYEVGKNELSGLQNSKVKLEFVQKKYSKPGLIDVNLGANNATTLV